MAKNRVSTAKKFAQIERISIMGITERMGPLALHTYADWYLDATHKLPTLSNPFEAVRAYLICHSIELGLKAFLALKGQSMLELSDGAYGHNLEAILQKAEEKQLSNHVKFTHKHKTEVRKASLYYSGKVFEYPAVGEALSGYPSMPKIDILVEAAKILADSIRKDCQEAK